MSQQYDAKKIEEYQLVLLKNPRSPVFAALAEAYRKMGLLEEALETTQKGIRHNPEFVSGLVAHAKVLFELKNYNEALVSLKKAVSLKPENILALRLTAHCYIKQKKHLKALRAYKKLLTLSPSDPKAISFIGKWEFLESLKFNNEDLEIDLENLRDWVSQLPAPQQAIHLIDSFLGQDRSEKATQVYEISKELWPTNQELISREKLLYKDMDPIKQKKLNELKIRQEFYQNLLHRIESQKSLNSTQHP